MKKQEKIFEVENLTQKINDARSLVLVDQRGLTANQTNDLRKLVKKAGGELQVVKNSLLKRALVNTALLKKADDLVLTGNTMALFAVEDEIAPVKFLVAYGKNLSLLPVKSGFFGNQLFSSEEVLRYASLPGKEELRAKLVGILAHPSQRLVFGLNFNLQKLVLLLNQISKKVN